MNSRSRTGIFNIKLIIFHYIIATVIHPSTSTKNTTKVVLVAADKTRPLPISQRKWYWSQQTRPDHYQYHNKSGTGRSKSFICAIKKVGRQEIKNAGW